MKFYKLAYTLKIRGRGSLSFYNQIFLWINYLNDFLKIINYKDIYFNSYYDKKSYSNFYSSKCKYFSILCARNLRARGYASSSSCYNQDESENKYQFESEFKSEIEEKYIKVKNRNRKNEGNVASQNKIRKEIKKRIQISEKERKVKSEAFSKGYLSYLQNKFQLGKVNYLKVENNLKEKILELINQLESNKTYSILFLLQFYKKGEIKTRIVMNSIIISKNSNSEFISKIIKQSLIAREKDYKIVNMDGVVTAFYREWLSENDYNKAISPIDREKLINEVLMEEAEIISGDKLSEIKNFMDVEHINNYIKEFPKYDSIIKLNNIYEIEEEINKGRGGNENKVEELYNSITKLIKYLENFNNNNNNNNDNSEQKNRYKLNIYFTYNRNSSKIERVNDNEKIKDIEIKDKWKNGDEKEILLYFVFTRNDNNSRIVCVNEINSWISTIDYWNSKKYSYERWIDTKISNNKFSREINCGGVPHKYYIKSNDNSLLSEIEWIDKLYKFPNYKFPYKDKEYNSKIGTIDLETFSQNNDGNGNISGKLEVYAGGWALNNGVSEMYYLDNDKIRSGKELINLMFNDMFKLDNGKKVIDGYTIYAHNLGRFDSVFIIKQLDTDRYYINGIWNENSTIKVKIRDKETKQTIVLLDSINYFTTSLRKVLKGFECNILKGNFPHRFVHKNNLNYIGEIPEIKFYDNVSREEYNNLRDLNRENNWSLKLECLNYLRSDVLGLLEAINKFSTFYYEKHSINIVKYPTLASLGIAVFGVEFYNEENEIKMIKGPLEDFIRESYFGGNVNLFVNGKDRFVEHGYHVDINSQFPKAMLNKMPTGDPIFSTNTNLEYYFGYVFAKITPPSVYKLKNLFIQYIDDNGAVQCPRDTFYRWIKTDELKQSIKYGYTAEVICGINFPDHCNENELFGEYVNYFYDLKSNAQNQLERMIAKLMLNTLYGKFGQKERENRIRLVSKEEGEKLIKKYHYSYLSVLNENTVLIKYGKKINEKLRKLYDLEEKEIEMEGFKRYRGVQTAIQISSAISAYARMSINIYKNLEDNLLIYSDTDSLILKKKLPDHLMGNKIGQFKLESEFINGIFIRKKLYCYTDINENKLIKISSGVDSDKLCYSDYEKLANGIPITTNKDIFNIDWFNLNIEVKTQEVTLRCDK